ncbi:MAG: hypothetical protein ACLR9W_07935 [Enterobacter hormaechei]
MADLKYGRTVHLTCAANDGTASSSPGRAGRCQYILICWTKSYRVELTPA